MKALERPTARPKTPSVVRIPEIERPEAWDGTSPPRRRRWIAVAIVSALVAVTAIGAGVVAYRDRVAEVGRLEQQVASLQDQVGGLTATEVFLRSTVRRLDQTSARLADRVAVLSSAFQRTQIGQAKLAEQLAKTEATLAAVRDRRAALATYLGSLHLCSAAGMPALTVQAGLPSGAAAMRADIGEAATTCDLLGLRTLAMAELGQRFWFGGDLSLGPAATWAVGEVRDEAPTRYLVGMLSLSYGTREVGDHTVYVWPAAAAFRRWVNVPAADRIALRDWYTPEEMRVFRETNAYSGYRVQIRDSGNWTVFLNG